MTNRYNHLLAKIHMKRSSSTTLKWVAMLFAAAVAGHASAQVTFFENDGFHGRSFTAQGSVPDFGRFGFNDRASSVVVVRDSWEVCDNAGFSGRCTVLQPGRYPSLAAIGLNDRLSSARIVNTAAPAQAWDDRRGPPPSDDNWRRRRDERVFDANVLAVHAVVGPPQQRCWVEREQVQERGGVNRGGAVLGAVIGGILGHQVGGGTGRDLATVGGAVAGGAVGANVNREDDRTSTRDVQRCRSVAGSERPEYWDVTYTFRGQEHHVQTTSPPGRTVQVNWQGEPRI